MAKKVIFYNDKKSIQLKKHFYPVVLGLTTFISIHAFSQNSIGVGTTTPGSYGLAIERSNDNGGATDAPAILVKNTSTFNPNNNGYNIAWANFISGNGAISGLIATNYGTGTAAPWNVGSGLLIATRTNHPVIFCSGSTSTEKMRITSTGNVGIGTNSPQDLLHIAGGNLRLSAGSEFFFEDNGQIRSLDNNHRILFRRSENKMELREYGNIIFSSGSIAGTETATMVLDNNGNVGIGTSTPKAKLAVSGDVFAKRIKVTLSDLPDYVFKASYRLRPLSEVEQYIKQYGHLPEMPSAVEVEKNGLDVGDNQATLLKKIEELTLYVIEQNKRIQALETKMQALEDKK